MSNPVLEPPSRGGSSPRSPFCLQLLTTGPSTRSAVCVLVVSRVWPTEGPALLLLAAFIDPQTQLQHPIPTASAHTYRAFSPLSPSVPSSSLLVPPLPSLALTRTKHTAPDAQQPGQCPYVACCTLPCRPRPPVAPDTLRRPTDRLCISPLLFNYPGIGTLLLLGLGARLV